MGCHLLGLFGPQATAHGDTVWTIRSKGNGEGRLGFFLNRAPPLPILSSLPPCITPAPAVGDLHRLVPIVMLSRWSFSTQLVRLRSVGHHAPALMRVGRAAMADVKP